MTILRPKEPVGQLEKRQFSWVGGKKNLEKGSQPPTRRREGRRAPDGAEAPEFGSTIVRRRSGRGPWSRKEKKRKKIVH